MYYSQHRPHALSIIGRSGKWPAICEVALAMQKMGLDKFMDQLLEDTYDKLPKLK